MLCSLRSTAVFFSSLFFLGKKQRRCLLLLKNLDTRKSAETRKNAPLFSDFSTE
jgi:hypothetical protein